MCDDQLLKGTHLVAAVLVAAGFTLGLLQALRVLQFAGLMDWLMVLTFSAMVVFYWARKRRQATARPSGTQ